MVAAVLAAGLGTGGAYEAAAQEQAKPTTSSDYPVDLALTYQTLRRTKTPRGSGNYLNGGAVALHADLYHGLGVAMDFTGEHATTGAPPLSLFTVTFGLRYTQKLMHNRFAVFGEALGGEAMTYNSNLQGTRVEPTPANGSAVQVGGGVDLRFHSHLALRLIQGDWIRTTLQDGGTNVQNNVRIGSGLVFRFGSK